MAETDYTSRFSGPEIDARLAKIPTLESEVSGKQDALQSGVNIKTINGQPIVGPGNIDTGGQITVDSELSESSTNPVQNKVITTALAGKQATLVGSGTGQNIKTINNESILGPGNINVQGGQDGEDGVGFDDVSTNQDGTIVITLTNGDTITIDINHQHPQYPKYVYCSSQAAYDAITTKESDTLYLIPETS